MTDTHSYADSPLFGGKEAVRLQSPRRGEHDTAPPCGKIQTCRGGMRHYPHSPTSRIPKSARRCLFNLAHLATYSDSMRLSSSPSREISGFGHSPQCRTLHASSKSRGTLVSLCFCGHCLKGIELRYSFSDRFNRRTISSNEVGVLSIFAPALPQFELTLSRNLRTSERF